MKELLEKEKLLLEEERKKELYDSILKDFEKRSEERKSFEAQWQLNMNFLMGNQYCAITDGGEIEEYEKQFFWQEREVFNHIAPLVEVRLSKLSRVRPVMTVVPSSGDEEDVKTAKMSKQILDFVSSQTNFSYLISEATKWSEVCGTSFYKVTWNSSSGVVVAKDENGNDVFDGDIDISIVSPFEIYPDSVASSDIDSCESVIHARALSVEDVREIWGVDVKGEDVSVYSLDSSGVLGGLGYKASAKKVTDAKRENFCLIIEKYEKPSAEYPNGRLTIIGGEKVLFEGELPFINKSENRRGFPFVRQVALDTPGSFWGTSIIERTIPIQRAYNAVKNRKHEFLNRISMGVLTVEDGSVDIENLEDEGLSPGKILVYRQGATPPSFMASGHVPTDFQLEEERLQNEFLLISGVSDLMRNSSVLSDNVSGVALNLMIEQDETRIASTIDSIKEAIKKVGSHILRLFKQFAIFPKLAKVAGNKGEVEVFYFSSGDINSDEVVFETDNELTQSVAQKRSMVFDLLKNGLLHDENGKLSNSARMKVLELLGFGVWQNGQDITLLHSKKAESENLKIISKDKALPLEIDDHDVHINIHTAFMLGSEFEKKQKRDEKIVEKFLEHIRLHKQMKKISEQLDNPQIEK